jgi:two-component system sensor histidine kinase PilS (NtrC family)
VHFNRPAREMLGLDDSDLGRELTALVPGIDELLAGPTRPAGRLELEYRHPEGEAIHLGLTVAPLVGPHGEGLGQVVHFQDVTLVHELGAQVRRNERLAAIGGLAASVAHEVRNPLTAIAGSAELLAHSDLGEEDDRLLQLIRRESTRLDKLVGDLLAYTRPRPLQPVQLDLARAAAETAEAFRADPGNSGIEVHFSAEAGAVANADPSLLTQVLWNLMRNSRDAMDGRGLLQISVAHSDDSAIISVKDSGPGIEPENLERIFDPFFTTKEHGTGFGLAVCNRIVEEHGGTLKVVSEPGEGAEFTVSIPLLEPASIEDG